MDREDGHLVRAPFDSKGNLQHYPESSWDYTKPPGNQRVEPDWRKVGQTYLTLELDGFLRDRSAAYFMWRDIASGCTYPMFMKDMSDLLCASVVAFGESNHHIWAIVKRGQNYGIKAVL